MSDPTNRASEVGQINITLTDEEKAAIYFGDDWWSDRIEQEVEQIIAARLSAHEAEIEARVRAKIADTLMSEADEERRISNDTSKSRFERDLATGGACAYEHAARIAGGDS